MSGLPERTVRARFDDSTITVYQAFASRIAEPALQSGQLVPPFDLNRMTWIKPSFLWMMYRSGWATKPDQERVLSIAITRNGFEWALMHSSLSQFDPLVHPRHEDWVRQRDSSPVRVQWDPDRTLQLQRDRRRAVQIGLSGPAVHRYIHEWTESICDVTPLARQIDELLKDGRSDEAEGLLPQETRYPLPEAIKPLIGAD